MESTDSLSLPDDLVTTNRAAQIAKCHLASVYRWILAGRLRAWKRVGRLLVSEAEVRALLTPVVPVRERPRLVPTPRQEREAQAWTEKVLREAGLV